MSVDDKVLSRAVSTRGVHSRSEVNKQFGSSNFDRWVADILQGVSFTSVLDFCCGTGNQLVLYAQRAGLRELVGVDTSEESLKVAQQRLSESPLATPATLIGARMEEVFGNPELAKAKFDLISCFYGLYYARDVSAVLNAMMDHLCDMGTILIVGPYGENNATLFELLERHIELPDLVKRSSSTFMTQEVVPHLQEHLEVRTETFVNRICYPEPKAVIDYWRASTFFEQSVEEAVVRDVETHFKRHGEFVVEKHVMAAIASQPTG